MGQEEKLVLPCNSSLYGTEKDNISLEPIKNEEKEEEMDMKTKIGFGFGHLFNDITSSATSGYALLYFTAVIRLSNVHVGLIFLIGNTCEAFVVIATGLIIDLDFKCRIYDLYGKLKSWHLVGTICLLVNYILLFSPPLGMEIEVLITTYYTAIYVMYNLGYSIIAIAHNSLISKLATSEKDQVTMSSIKNSGRGISGITFHLLAYFCFSISEDGNLSTSEFTNFVLMTSVAGVAASVLFHLLVKESIPNQNRDTSESAVRARYKSESIPISIPTRTKSQWLTDATFYIVILIYAISRLFLCVCMSYLVFFAQYTLLLEKVYIAIAPLTMVISGLILSKPIIKIINTYGLEKSLICFGIVGVGACTWIWFGCISEEFIWFELIGASAFLGISSYSMLVASLALVARLIGKNIGKYFQILFRYDI